ncbi:MAG: AI-2E family transporter [Candidatus Colwellbacteria bacterium]|nr:AI-2E family transporter [Candidatus Colwellbacteria bacterium]
MALPLQKIDISSSTIFRTILILLAFWFFYLIRDILVILLGAIVVAAAIEPVANRLQRYRLPRVVSVLAVYIAILAILALVVTLILPILVQQTTQLVQALPHVLLVAQDVLGNILPGSSETLIHQLQGGLARFSDAFGNIGINVFQQTRSVFGNIVSVVFMFVIALYLVIEENALMKFFRIIVPAEHQTYVNNALGRVQYKLGRWVLGQVTLGIIIGVTVAVGLTLMGVPYALALGLLAGVLEIIPYIGPILAGLSATIVAFSASWVLGLATLVFFILVQQAESHFIIPNVMKKATGLNPLVTLIAVLLGARLAGVAGIILSVPVASMIGIFFSDVFMGEGKKD